MRDLELRRWVERMLSGEFQPAGLDRLLPNLRFKTNAVHFTTRMAAVKSMRVTGCGARGLSG